MKPNAVPTLNLPKKREAEESSEHLIKRMSRGEVDDMSKETEMHPEMDNVETYNVEADKMKKPEQKLIVAESIENYQKDKIQELQQKLIIAESIKNSQRNKIQKLEEKLIISENIQVDNMQKFEEMLKIADKYQADKIKLEQKLMLAEHIGTYQRDKIITNSKK